MGTATPPSKTVFRVLIADRNPRVRELLARELGQDGVTVLGARNGEEAARTVAAGGVDLAVLADDLPDLGGLDALRRIRRVATMLPVVAMAYSAQDAQPYLREKHVAYVRKGENVGALTRAIMMMLKRNCPLQSVSGDGGADRAGSAADSCVQAGESGRAEGRPDL